ARSSRGSQRPRLGHPKTRFIWRPVQESRASLFHRCSVVRPPQLCSLLPATKMFSDFFAELWNRRQSTRTAASRLRRSSEDQATRLFYTSISFVASCSPLVLN